MKNFVFLLSVIFIFISCEEYEFEDENISTESPELKINIQEKDYEEGDSVIAVKDIQIIFKAVINENEELFVFFWDFGDGNSKTGRQVNHSYNQEGSYLLTLSAVGSENTITTEIVMIIQDSIYTADSVYLLYQSFPPNSSGKVKYIVSCSKDYIPSPPVLESGPYGYQGSNPESEWNIVEIEEDTSSNRIYYEIITYNEVYSQAYGGFKENNEFVWANMENSRFYNYDDNYLKVGFQDGSLVQEENFNYDVLGCSGDSGENPEIRFNVMENEIEVFVNIISYSPENINSPKARFKILKEDSWSEQLNTTWKGGTGYVKYVVPINDQGQYRLRIEPDHNELGSYTNMEESSFYSEDENCFIWQIAQINNGTK